MSDEASFTKGRVIVRGKMVSRGAARRADYVLSAEIYGPFWPEQLNVLAKVDDQDDRSLPQLGPDLVPSYAAAISRATSGPNHCSAS